MICRECGSENFATDGGWYYCRNCGRVVGFADYSYETEYIVTGATE